MHLPLWRSALGDAGGSESIAAGDGSASLEPVSGLAGGGVAVQGRLDADEEPENGEPVRCQGDQDQGQADLASGDQHDDGDDLDDSAQGGGDEERRRHSGLFPALGYSGPEVPAATVAAVRARTLDYVSGIVDKSIPSNKWIRLAARRFQDQLDDERFRMDWDAGARAVAFLESLAFTDAGEPVTLEPWQVWATVTQYGLLWRHNAEPVVSLTVCQVGRGAGKTTWAAGLGLYEFLHGPKGGRQYLVANKREQSQVAFESVSAMLRGTFPDLADRVGKWDKLIDRDRNVRLGMVASKDRTLDGLKPTWWFGDEASEWRGRFIVKVTTAAAKMKRSRGLICTTPGDNPDLIYTAEILEVAYRVLEGDLDLPHQAYFLFGLDEEDEPEDESAWLKANPGLPRLPTWQGLRNQWAVARLTPQGRAEFVRFHGARFARSANRWLDMTYWDECRDRIDPATLHGRPAWGGLDLSKSGDLAAFVLAIPTDDGRILLHGRYWWPRRAARNREVEYGLPLRQWELDRRLTLTDSDEIDYDLIRAEVTGAARAFDLRIVGYDAWGSTYLAQTLEKRDGVSLGRYSMGIANIGPATQEWQRHWIGRRFIHNDDPVLRRCCADAAAKRDDAGNIRPVKARERCVIDGLIAAVMAVHCWALTQDGGLSDYEIGATL